MSAFDDLDRMIAKCREIPAITRRAAPDVATAMRKEILRTTSAGTDAEGKPWKPKIADGGRPLVDAASAVRVAVIDTRVLARVTGPEARHHTGRVKGGTQRGIIPTRLTPRLAERVREILNEHFRAIVEG